MACLFSRLLFQTYQRLGFPEANDFDDDVGDSRLEHVAALRLGRQSWVAIVTGFCNFVKEPDCAARPFFGELTEFMSSGKVVVLALEAEGAILKWRDTMGATDPAKAAPGTIRRDLGTSIGNNCTHGSDAPDTAAFELGYFFAGYEMI